MKAILTALLLSLIVVAAKAQTGAPPKTGPYSPEFADVSRLSKLKAVMLSPISVHRKPSVEPGNHPGKRGLAAEINDGGVGIGLLLPAVQKVRDAAR